MIAPTTLNNSHMYESLDRTAAALLALDQDVFEDIIDRPPSRPASYASPVSTASSPQTSNTPHMSDLHEPFAIFKYGVSISATVFQKQVQREWQRLSDENRLLLGVHGANRPVRQFDTRLDYLANAENNVRIFWLECKIWRPGWGGAWKDSTHEYDNSRPSNHSRRSRPKPSGRWLHEIPPGRARLAARTVVRKNSRSSEHFEAQVRREMRRMQDIDSYLGRESDTPSHVRQRASEKIKKEWIEDGL